ncbi:hypothetical protein [Streptomyces sp. VB1]|uniref:hypothetical protein n=1 Tax=Streptomyces sp. VB1 TaxID=2986803 RepID=UPI0022421543|nr:hypothetical protein [Streptomyces sp. VB1]UZI29910.1 hypothetical protein OH133_18240 [Streptomyces sp. VB1]
MSLDADMWSAAVEMYRHRYSFVAVGPRTGEDWVPDVAAIMRREVADPRGWRGDDPEVGESELLEDPAFPFRVPPADGEGAAEWRSGLFEIPRSSVVRLLVMLATNEMNVTRQHGFADRRAGMECHAKVILSRFPIGSKFFTNTRHGGENPDFYERVSGCWPMSQYVWDFGLLSVSDEEIGLIWSFDAS